jgi:hypothetical protein
MVEGFFGQFDGGVLQQLHNLFLHVRFFVQNGEKTLGESLRFSQKN